MNSKKLKVHGGPNGATQVIGVLSKMSSDRVYIVDIREYHPKRSLEQNSLYWKWMEELALFLTNSTGQVASGQDMHEICRDRFLHTKVIEMNGDAFRLSRSTTGLNVSEMGEYMDKIDQWASRDLGCLLTTPGGDWI